MGNFHASIPSGGLSQRYVSGPRYWEKIKRSDFQNAGKNPRANGGYDRNHVILEAKGDGQYVGCNINIDNKSRFLFNWPGEGDNHDFHR